MDGVSAPRGVARFFVGNGGATLRTTLREAGRRERESGRVRYLSSFGRAKSVRINAWTPRQIVPLKQAQIDMGFETALTQDSASSCNPQGFGISSAVPIHDAMIRLPSPLKSLLRRYQSP